MNPTVWVPRLPCKDDDGCKKDYLQPLRCVNGQCECIEPLCWNYRYETQGMTASYTFTCGQCGKYTDDNYKLDLVIFYKGTKTRNCIIKNSLSNNSILQMSHVVYKINCPVEDCELSKP